MSLISVNNLTFHYEGSSDNIFEDVSFQIDTNWKLKRKNNFSEAFNGKV